MFEIITSPDAWMTLATLATLEIILGIDNLVMIAILVSALPQEKKEKARIAGIAFALVTRIMLLFTMAWLASLTNPLFHIVGHPFSIRDIVMFFGGAFLIYKGIAEIMSLMKPAEVSQHGGKVAGNVVLLVILQIGLFDIIFSLDSVITAVGMSNQMPVMVTAIVIAMAVMLFASKPVLRIIDEYVGVKILALCFLVLIGVMLALSGFGIHIPKGYLYAAMAFSAIVQIIMIVVAKQRVKTASEQA